MSAPPALLDHNALPSVATAPLPATYERAKIALAECARIDECREWADRAVALASYGRQAEDKELTHNAMRILARAIHRMGELFQEIEPARGANQNIDPDVGTKVLTRKDAASAAGISKRRKDTALQVASVPPETFDTLVESNNPPSITKLAELGTKHKPLTDLGGRDPDDFAAATPFISLPKEFLEEASGFDLERAWRGMNDDERAEARVSYLNCVAWITQAWEVLDGL